MQNLIFIITVVLAGILIPSNAQSKYETEMGKALTKFGESETKDDMEKAAQHFDRISKVETEKWLPLYYSMFIRTLNAFSLDKDKALKQVDELESLYANLENMKNIDKSEVLTLRGLFRTVKVAKDPMTYGMSLSGAIIKDYDDALKLNPNNPRAMYLLAQYNMGGAEFWGKDPKDYCPQIEKAKTLFSSEKKENFEPKWGEEQVDEILNSTCKK
ncbi:hypothetical protein [Moheibacter sediminis]|uniref:Tetratricopeptide repeat-containing protein n=1 Tax=Moheibacter sediminis TaxID=1434700 RepID=A0A1W2BVK0_9FLAO|nr:hypothetical protein [Moheibacter sediminis]SMC76746.1 hypothetical protein SAMN06296427_107168 [Moheibacter sediminis]